MFSQSNGLLECFSLGDKSDKDWGFISADVIAWTPLLKPRAQFVKFRKKIKTSRKITKNVQWVLAPDWLILNRFTDEFATKITYGLIQGRAWDGTGQAANCCRDPAYPVYFYPSPGPEKQKTALNRSGLVNKKTWTDNLMIFIIFNRRDDPPYLTLATRAKVNQFGHGGDKRSPQFSE